ncbi:MAG: rod shape-determining protein RodA [Lachnospiraceae bacterium]|nr:rod shape-determining protein RodA [Lachnospiraceae bacterium]
MFHNYKVKNYNLRLVLALMALTILGIMVIGSADADKQGKQIIGMALGLVVMVIVSLIDYEFVLRFHYYYYAGAILLLLVVLTPLGYTVAGATRWIKITDSFRFQPSELAKILLILFFAWYLQEKIDDINKTKTLIFIVAFAVLPLFLIIKEPDLSTTIVTFSIIFVMLFMSDLSYKITGILVGVGAPFVAIILLLIKHRNALLLKIMGYQSLRILAWMFPEEYPESSYQQQNSIMAVGSGRFYGKGLNTDSISSVKNGNYISEPHTDFIFAVAGEELGFIGSVLIVVLLLIIVIECLRVAKHAKNKAGELICVGMASLVAVQSFVNICVVTGLMPNTGIPLPFVSYGVTSLTTLYFGMGFVLNVGLQSKRTWEE